MSCLIKKMDTEAPFSIERDVDEDTRHRLTTFFDCIFKCRSLNQQVAEAASWDIVVKNNKAGQPDYRLGLQLQSHQITSGLIKSYCHIFQREQTDDPDDDISIRNGDELLLLNDKFALYMPIEDLKRGMYNLKVDGQTTITMMIRRKSRNEWKWYNIYTILAPEGEDSSVKYFQYSTDCKKMTGVLKSDHVYRIPGSQSYLQLDDDGLKTNVLSGNMNDASKIITKRTIICLKGGKLKYKVSLRDKELGRGIKFCRRNQTIVLSDNPEIFQYHKLADQTYFSKSGYYLGYDRIQNVLKPQRNEFGFEEFPVPGHLTQLSKKG